MVGIEVYQQADIAVWVAPRCASTSTATWLTEAGFVRGEGAATQRYAIIRDPFDRYLSCLSVAWPGRFRGRKRQGTAPPWSEFLAGVEDSNRAGKFYTWGDNIHFKQQSWFRDQGGQTLIRLDELRAFISLLQNRGIGAGISFPHRNRTGVQAREIACATISRGPVLEHYADDNLAFTTAPTMLDAIERGTQ